MGLQRLVAISNQLPKFHKKPNEMILLKFPLDNIFERLLMDLEFRFLHLFFAPYRDWRRYNEKIRFLCYSKVIWGHEGPFKLLEGAEKPKMLSRPAWYNIISQFWVIQDHWGSFKDHLRVIRGHLGSFLVTIQNVLEHHHVIATICHTYFWNQYD